MKIGDTIRRESPWGDVITREIKSEGEIKNYFEMQQEGFKLDVLIDGVWVKVIPK